MKDIFGNTKRAKILLLFLESPSARLTQKQVLLKTKISKATGVKHLKSLVKQGLLKLERLGQANIYSLNTETSMVKQLKILNTLSNLQRHSIKKGETYLFGSAARGEDDEHSDIDLLVISKLKREELLGETEKLSKKTGKHINLLLLNPREWDELGRKDPALHERIEKDRIRLP